MKKLSFKSVISLVLALVLTFSVAYMPGMSLEASAACAGGCSFTAQKVGVKYLKNEKTCGKQAVYYYSCAICGLSSGETNEAKTFNYGEKPEHNWGPTQTLAATCTMPESTVRTCSRCGEKYIKKGSGDALGHNNKYISNGDGTHTKICTRDGCTLHEVSDCSTAVLVCGVIPVCDICNTPYGKTTTHNFGVWKITKPSTCKEKGEMARTCFICGFSEFLATEESHYINEVIISDNCDNGAYKRTVCTICNLVFEETKLSSINHSYKKTTFPVTCVSDGYDLFECTICGYSYKDNWVTDRQHTYVKTTKDATCTSTGFITYACSVCGSTKENVTIPALGHDMIGFQVSKEPTCTEDGLLVDKCKRCARTVTETVPALGHDLDIAVIPATCTEGGFTKSTCKRCNYVEEYNNIPALGHDKKITNAIAPTCIYDGYHVYTCARCGIEDREKLPALGHEYEYTPDGNATCLQDGTRTGKCIRCPKTVTDADPGSALGHSFTLYISNSNATCTDNATEWAACDRGCGAKDVREIPNSALGHNYVGNLCTRCHAVKDDDSSDCKHIYPDNWNVIITPDCQNKGAQVKVCTLCKNIISESLPKTGHIDHNGDSKCDTCDRTIVVVDSDKTEEKPCDCNCHAGGIKAFFFKLVNFFAKIFDKNARVCDCGKAH